MMLVGCVHLRRTSDGGPPAPPPWSHAVHLSVDQGEARTPVEGASIRLSAKVEDCDGGPAHFSEHRTDPQGQVRIEWVQDSEGINHRLESGNTYILESWGEGWYRDNFEFEYSEGLHLSLTLTPPNGPQGWMLLEAP
jgi:hypothetical protein